MKISPNISAIIFAWVLLPDPGGPIMIILGGLLGASFLNLRSSIFLSSAVTSDDVLSSAPCSKMN